jgi:hypothetical protein
VAIATSNASEWDKSVKLSEAGLAQPAGLKSCEHVFMTSQGHPRARFRRAIQTADELRDET